VEDKLWAALHANPDSTASELSDTAAIGKSTAAKILARWAGEGNVRRTCGISEGGRRAADRWSITKTGDSAEVDVEVAPEPPPASESADTAVPVTVDQSTDCAAGAGPAVDHAPADVTADTVDEDGVSGGARAAGEKAPRLAPGGLRGLVEDFLRDHSSEEFSPSRIGKELDRSSGAVHNALEKLVATGYAVQTNAAPKRYALAPTQDAPATDAPAT
jgi:predicted transcriptional regulator